MLRPFDDTMTPSFAMDPTLAACPVPLAIFDRHLSIAAINAAFSELTGYPFKEIVGRWPAFLSGADRTQSTLLRARFEAMVDDPGARDDVCTVLTTRSGRAIRVRLQSTRLEHDQDRSAFIVALYELPASTQPSFDPAPARAHALDGSSGERVDGLGESDADRMSNHDLLRRQIAVHGDMLVLLGPSTGADGESGRLRVLDCNAQVDALMGVDPQAVMAASGALLTNLPAADRLRLLTALRRVRGAVGNQAGNAAAHGPSEVELTVSHPRRGERLIRLRLIVDPTDSQRTLLIGEDISESRRRDRQAAPIVSAQRDVLVREVHHRIKNNLQGVAGLLRQVADRHPTLAASLDDIAGQVQAIAQVHGLHVRDDGPASIDQMIESVFTNLARNFGVPIAIESPAATQDGPWRLPESEAVPIALVINELGTNAIKHNLPDGRVAVRWSVDTDSVSIEVSNHGVLPAEFDFVRLTGGGSGLSLVKAMLPRRGADLAIDMHGDRVLARLRLRRPVLIRPDGSHSAEAYS